MTSADRWLLPDGVEEVLPPQAIKLERLRRVILDFYRSWGYEQVFPPMVEYLESLLTGSGNDLALQTFKFTDPMTGHLMGIRADMTPQVARIDAHTLNKDGPARLCYAGHVLHSKPANLTASRSLLQVGAELYGHSGIDADIEMISLMLETLILAGCKGVHLDLGHVGIYRALIAVSGLEKPLEEELFSIYQRKAVPELQEFVEQHVPDEGLSDMFMALSQLAGDRHVLTEARQRLADGPGVIQEALDDMECIADRIEALMADVTLYFDIGELRGYHYHTGPVFSAYLPGVGQEIAKGGRYDHIGEVFGRARPATGFSTNLECLIKFDNKPVSSELIFAPADSDPALLSQVAELRSRGIAVVMALSGQAQSAKQMGCTGELCNLDGKWVVKEV